MTALEEIISWSRHLPIWQQDALRRLLQQDNLLKEDILELVELCKQEYGLKISKRITPIPVDDKDVPQAAVDNHSISLLQINEVQGVNALSNSEILSFSPNGITIIYGDNGAGKSGYSRIIKNITRARATEKILPNVFDTESVEPQAKITFDIDGTAQKEVLWKAEGEKTVELSAISFFDSDCAHEYVDGQSSIAYRPFGLDLFDKLAHVCDLVKEQLQEELVVMNQSIIPPAKLIGDTTTVHVISELSAETKEDDIEEIAKITAEEKKRAEFLKTQIAKAKGPDLNKQIQTHSTIIAYIESLMTHLPHLHDIFSDTAITLLLKAKTDAETYKKAAELAAKESFDNELPGVGQKEWKVMWEAAKEYSERFAYPKHKFPHIADGAKCPLCQQSLSKDAQSRLSSFDKFVQDTTAQKANAANIALKLARDPYDKLIVKPAYWEMLSPHVDENLAKEIKEYFNQSESYLSHIKEVLDNDIPYERIELKIPSVELLAAEVQKQKDKIDTIKKIQQPEELGKLQKEVDEYDARMFVANNKAQIIQQLALLRHIKNHKDCIDKINTSAISRKSSEMTQKYITEALCQQFAAEIQKLRLTNVKVQLVSVGSKKGVTYHQIQLQTAAGNGIRLADIASEGEHRCIALAGFLTELTTAEHKSAIVLDDPVSSLDHNNREEIAERLVEEAQKRQVVIFTHDLVFVMLIRDIADRLGLPSISTMIYSEKGKAGIVQAGTHWKAMKTSERIAELNRLHQEARTIFNTVGKLGYEIQAKFIYGRLRETWERAVEEVLLGGAIIRFRQSIQTQSLKDVRVLDGDYTIIEANMAKCSKYLPGHDEAPDVNAPVPDLTELEQDISILKKFVEDIKERKKQVN